MYLFHRVVLGGEVERKVPMRSGNTDYGGVGEGGGGSGRPPQAGSPFASQCAAKIFQSQQTLHRFQIKILGDS